MSLEDEARRLAEQYASEDAERAAGEKRSRALRETPAPPSWTGELIDMLESRYPDNPVYRVVSSDTARVGYKEETTIGYSLLGRGWCLNPYFMEEGGRTGQPSILLRDGNLHSGFLSDVENTSTIKHVGIPTGVRIALVADKLRTNASDPWEDFWHKLYGLGAAAAILSGSVEEGFGVLTWLDRSRD